MDILLCEYDLNKARATAMVGLTGLGSAPR
jgi:hypothetical protein